MFDFLYFSIGYIIVGIIFGFVTTKFTYKHSIDTNKNSIPKSKRYSTEELDILETNRRKKLAVEAITTGFWMGVFWVAALPIFIVMMVIGLIFKGFHHFAIKPTDKSFVTEKEYRKARAILDKYEIERVTLFDKELNGD